MPEAQTLTNEALKLGPVEKAELIERLLASFDQGRRKEIDALWAEEAESRVDAFDKGDIAASPAQEVFKRIG